MRRLLPAVGLAGLLLLSGCGGATPEVKVRDALNNVIAAANSKDPAQLDAAVDTFQNLINSQSGRDLPADEVQRLSVDVQKIKDDAALLTAVPSPTPSVTTPPPTSTSPSASPSPSPSPSPSASASPSATGKPTKEPKPPKDQPSPSTSVSAAAAAGDGNGNGNG